MSAAENCCLGCGDRHVGCHGRCERYAEWLKAKREQSAALEAARKQDFIADTYIRENSIRTKRRFGRK